MEDLLWSNANIVITTKLYALNPTSRKSKRKKIRKSQEDTVKQTLAEKVIEAPEEAQGLEIDLRIQIKVRKVK